MIKQEMILCRKKRKAQVLFGAAIGVTIGLYAIGWRGVDLCSVVALSAAMAYQGLIYWHGGRITWGGMFFGAPLIAFSAFIVATLYLVPGQEGRGMVMGSLAFLLSLVPYWLAKRAIRVGKIEDGYIIN